MHFVHPQVIERPLAEVFAFVSDPENLPRWNYYVIGCTKLEAGPTRVGSTYRLVRKSDTRVFGVTEFERDPGWSFGFGHRLRLLRSVSRSNPQGAALE
jgi:polyketide cyclase/dehydrase/lipid transport protein